MRYQFYLRGSAYNDRLAYCNKKLINRGKPLPIELLATLTYYSMLIGIGTVLICTCPVWIPLWLAWKGARKLITFVMGILRGIALVLSRMQGDRLGYAILKGNGRYIKSASEHCYMHQFYDYAARSMLFMSVGMMEIAELDSQANIVELECDSLEGLNYLRQNNDIASTIAICNDPQIEKKLRKMQKMYQNQVKVANFMELAQNTDEKIAKSSKIGQEQEKQEKQGRSTENTKLDCILLFDHKHKSTLPHCNSIFELLSFCTANLSKGGYIVFGQYFSQGQLQVYASLFFKYQLKVICAQDIQKNINYAHKLIRRKMGISFILHEIIQRILNTLAVNSPDQGKFHLLILERIQ